MFDELCFGICWYNDGSIFRLLASLPVESKKIIIDGKFKLNPNTQELSDYALREKVKEFPNVELIDAPNLSEPEKRNIYLKDNPYKYLFIIDSDEYIITADWEKAFDSLDNLKEGIHDIAFEIDDFGGISLYPRIWIYPKDYEYRLCHNIWVDKRRGIVYKSGDTGGFMIPGILCGMNDKLRHPDYLNDTVSYQEQMMSFERPYRQKYREGKLGDFI